LFSPNFFRLFAHRGLSLTKADLVTIEAEDIRGSRVFREGRPDGEAPASDGTGS
jgi:hypothetical protein